ncbi:MAG: 50S ribosomal protein L11 methyltransferase [Acidobacteriota bacterium]
MSDYQQLRFQLPPALEEELVAWLWDHGTLGVQCDSVGSDLMLTAYFPRQAAPAVDAVWQARGVRLAETRAFADQDWLATYWALAVPFEVGRGFVIDPRDPAAGLDRPPATADRSSGRSLLRIPAREAFGVGSHETTRLAIALLEDAGCAGARVLDVGTGSGILAFAAERLGAAAVVAFDLDPVAMIHARHNASLNHCAPRCFAGSAAALGAATFDRLVINVLPERIDADLAGLVARCRDGAEVILSGVLTVRRDEVLARWRGLGFEPAGERTDGDWIAFRLR